jgi:hypothetical protein
MIAKYSNMSPWFKTPVTQGYLDILKIRPVAAEVVDYLYTIEIQYKHRPDLLAYDLYGDPALWWVFTQRNLDVIQDPIFDFVPGTQIYIPQLSKLKVSLGI